MIVDYWANTAAVNRLAYFSTMPSSPTVTTSGGYYFYKWNFTSTQVTAGGSNTYDGGSFIT